MGYRTGPSYERKFHVRRAAEAAIAKLAAEPEKLKSAAKVSSSHLGQQPRFL
jgi:hypothetical protein